MTSFKIILAFALPRITRTVFVAIFYKFCHL